MNPKRIRTLVAITMLSTSAFLSSPSFSHDVKVPQSVEDHTAMAKQYQDKAAANRTEAADHRAMAVAYGKGVPKDKQGQNPWSSRMNKHCEALALSAEFMAVDEEKAAEYHNLRAKELQGK